MPFLVHFVDGKEAYLSHHGVKGMKWGVWNEETQEKYGSSSPSGGGAVINDDEDNADLTDEQKKERQWIDDNIGDIEYSVHREASNPLDGMFGNYTKIYYTYKGYDKDGKAHDLSSDVVEKGTFSREHNLGYIDRHEDSTGNMVDEYMSRHNVKVKNGKDRMLPEKKNA